LGRLTIQYSIYIDHRELAMKTILCDAIEFQNVSERRNNVRVSVRIEMAQGFICRIASTMMATLYRHGGCISVDCVSSRRQLLPAHLPPHAFTVGVLVLDNFSNNSRQGGASATRLASQLQRPYKTIWHVLHS